MQHPRDMIGLIKAGIWQQFGASIDMLHNAINAFDPELLNKNPRIFYTIYHVLVFLDYYLAIPPKNFTSPLPFTLQEIDAIPADALDDVVPDRIYTRDELLEYFRHTREKARTTIMNLTETSLHERFQEDDIPGGMDYSTFEILLYNMRHVQHHTAQLNLFLRMNNESVPRWIGRAE
jgi:hypothetical protein